MNLENRVEKLENAAGAGDEPIWLVVVYDGAGRPGDDAVQAAKTRYKQDHPDWEEQAFNVIHVTDEAAKANVQRVMRGERT
jgi:hypothetical protein